MICSSVKSLRPILRLTLSGSTEIPQVVHTHHHVGSVVTNFKEQKTIIDLNREVFVLSKINGEWKIFFYTFNTNPLQGVA